jgi:hypothetical protein
MSCADMNVAVAEFHHARRAGKLAISRRHGPCCSASAMKIRRLSVGVLALVAACGNGSSQQDGSSTPDGSSPDGSSPDGSTPDGSKALSTCGTAQPLIDSTTGFEQCSAGYVRRTAMGACPSHVPRSGAVPNYHSADDQCQFDSDCDTATYGPYAHCDTREGGFAKVCVPGCIHDSDCVDNHICLCGDAVGRCVLSNCATSSDCGAGLECASYDVTLGCFSTRFACQTPGDSCRAGADCHDFSVNATFCTSDGTARRCSIVQCTTP